MAAKLRVLADPVRYKDLSNRIEALTGEKMASVDSALARYLQSPHIPVSEMGSYLAMGRGKRIRPTILLLASRMLGYEGDRDVTYAAIYELVHTASLIHDDIVDQALLRRGRPSLNARYGAEMAVLMGDYVFTLALDLSNRLGNREIMTLISRTTLNLVQGELLQSHHKWDLNLPRESYIEIIRCKTAQLFAACAQTPAYLTESGEGHREALESFGLNMGLAFQIVDDCLDFSSDDATLGKPTCSDLKEGKITLPLLLLMEKGTTEDRSFVEAVVAARRFDPDTLREVVARTRRSGTLREAEQVAASYTQKAQDALARLPAGEIQRLLNRLPDFALHRKF